MRAAFHRPDDAAVVGWAEWTAQGVRVGAEGDLREALQRVYRPTPVVVDDPSLRRPGTTGPVVLVPGSLTWFRAASATRSSAEELVARLVPGPGGAGWDPAGSYRTFTEANERKERTVTGGG